MATINARDVRKEDIKVLYKGIDISDCVTSFDYIPKKLLDLSLENVNKK